MCAYVGVFERKYVFVLDEMKIIFSHQIFVIFVLKVLKKKPQQNIRTLVSFPSLQCHYSDRAMFLSKSLIFTIFIIMFSHKPIKYKALRTRKHYDQKMKNWNKWYFC